MLALADSAGGKRALCPNCSNEFRVPDLPVYGVETEELPAARDPALNFGTRASAGELIRCPACDRTLAVDPSMAGQPIICPTCKRRLRVPAANESSILLASDLGNSRPSDPYGVPPLGSDPFGGMPTLPGSIPGMQTGTNYALPGAFLAILGALGTLVFSLSLLGAMIGVFGQKAPMDLEHFVVTLLWSVTSMVAQLLTFIGGIQMMRRRQLKWAKLGAFAALYPCGSCIALQLPIAIWAIVILNREIAVYDFASPMDRYDEKSQR
ncbi:MAG TPA: hypothetical protein DDZ51_31465 [Planctomycetaceae bacterium]|nr:hypothetical protein [Planctomycetaceae bacterium]